MAEKQSQRDRIKEITDGIEQGIKDMFNSDNFRQYLKTMSRFHHYSLNNIILIQQQCPHATHVAGFTKWKNEFGRNVRKGEKGIRILAPAPVKKKIEMTKIDPDTRMPAKDENGNDLNIYLMKESNNTNGELYAIYGLENKALSSNEMQYVFIVDDESDEIRTGGFGSTSK